MAILADFLTLIRLPLGLVVIYAGASSGPAALPQVVWISLAVWTADTVDGHLKRAASADPGWVGRHDITFDVFYSTCLAVFLTLAGYASAWIFSIWVGALGLLGFKARSRSGVIVAEGLAILMLFIQAIQRALSLGGTMLAWGAVTLALDRKRFAYRFNQFVHGFRGRLQQDPSPAAEPSDPDPD